MYNSDYRSDLQQADKFEDIGNPIHTNIIKTPSTRKLGKITSLNLKGRDKQ
jgi:hypothetical protein